MQPLRSIGRCGRHLDGQDDAAGSVLTPVARAASESGGLDQGVEEGGLKLSGGGGEGESGVDGEGVALGDGGGVGVVEDDLRGVGKGDGLEMLPTFKNKNEYKRPS